MMNKWLPILLPVILTGCLTAKPPAVAEWTVRTMPSESRAETPTFGVTRLSQLSVRAPYEARAIGVHRADNTFKSDPYNHFAALPSQLLKGAAQDILTASGRFASVVPATSAASASHLVEVTVTDLRLDCTTDVRSARAGVSLLVLDRDRKIVGAAVATGASATSDGDFGSAFSKAFTQALERAVESL